MKQNISKKGQNLLDYLNSKGISIRDVLNDPRYTTNNTINVAALKIDIEGNKHKRRQ